MGYRGLRTALVTSSAIYAAAVAGPAWAQTKAFNVPAQAAVTGIPEFARQADIQILVSETAVRGKTTKAVRGAMSVRQALGQLLRGTGLRVASSDGRTVTLVAASAASGSGGATTTASGEDADRSAGATPDILVIGHQTKDVDIRRTRNDAQPYVILDAQDIQNSNATTVEEFLNTRLPMNGAVPLSLNSSLAPNRSNVNLRGLGPNQTLILVDGRRMPNFNDQGTLGQPDINGIPVGAIDRIETLPTTAAGIYGGGATGGVVNIVTKADFTGLDVKASYGNTTRGDDAEYRIDGTLGLSLEGGRTRILISGSHRHSQGLLVGDRDFAQDGRALLYGNDRLAFVNSGVPATGAPTTNIVSADGSDLVLKNGTPLNSSFTYVPRGYTGTSDGGNTLVANAGQQNVGVSDDEEGGRANQLPRTDANTIMANVRRDFGSRLSIFSDFMWLQNRAGFFPIGGGSVNNYAFIPTGAPNNPFTTDIYATFPIPGLVKKPNTQNSIVMRATGGAILRLPYNWVASADYTWGKAVTRLTRVDGLWNDGADAGLSDGTLDVIRDVNARPVDFSPYLFRQPDAHQNMYSLLHDAVFRLTGPLVKLPGGELTISGSVERRTDSIGDYTYNYLNSDGSSAVDYSPPMHQTNTALYLEARVPIFSAANAIPLFRELELQISGRHDEYTTVASPTFVTLPDLSALPPSNDVTSKVHYNSFNVGARYSPVSGITFRGSYGTGFLPPSINQIAPLPPFNPEVPFIDPKRGNVMTTAIVAFTVGGNPNLQPETSKSWSVGAILTPSFLPGFRLSVDYTNIKKSNGIESLPYQTLLDLEDTLKRITRAPLTDADKAKGYTGGVVTAIDDTLVNVASSELKAVDFQLDYSWKTVRLGDFRVYAIASYEPVLQFQALAASETVNSAGYASGTLRWRGNAGIDWNKGPWTIAYNAQYYDSYFVYVGGSSQAEAGAATTDQGSSRIPSQFYNDIAITYRVSAQSSALSGLEFALNFNNIFDKKPPLIATTGLAGFSTYGDPRLRRFTFSVRKKF